MTCNKDIKITIIGGSRGLGNWIAKKLIKDNFNVTITSRNYETGYKIAEKIGAKYSDNNIESVKDADITIFSTPIENMNDTIKEVAPHTKENSLIIDVTSVKKEVTNTLLEHTPEHTEILPCHPMFGPRVPSLEGQVVILTPLPSRCQKWYDKIIKYLEDNKAHIVLSTPEEHDKTMSVVQGLTHFSYISIASTIRKLDICVKKSREFASPVYSLMMDMISRIVSQNPYLYYSIQKSNDETSLSRKKFIKEINYLANLIEEGNEEQFVHEMSESAKHLDEFEEALGRSDKAISTLTRELNILKNSIGTEIGLEHQYSHNIHVGIVKDVDAKRVTLSNLNGDETTLKLSNVKILSDEELLTWKKTNLTVHHFDVSVLFLKTCDVDVLLDIISNIDVIIDANVKEVYEGIQVPNDHISITFHYCVFDKKDKAIVEEYLKGMGGIIR